MIKTPSSLRLHIGIFGKRNTGKSSLMNLIAGKSVSIVASEPGTTADPVKKSLEIETLGPALLVDTAGLDDIDALGEKRIAASRKVIESTDLAVVIFEAGKWSGFEEILVKEFQDRNAPVIALCNKIDLVPAQKDEMEKISQLGIPVLAASAKTGEGLDELMHRFIESAPDEWINSPPVLLDLINPDDVVIQVMPIDIEAPKGRILLPQVQGVRDVLDREAVSIVVKETDLKETLENLEGPPDMVVTDSQAFGYVAPLTPPESQLTSYSTLFARSKGDLPSYIRGAYAADKLKKGDRVLIAEACVHHPIGNDIGRVQIPSRVDLFAGGGLEFDFVQGKDYPDDLSPYSLIIHCGACVLNRKQTLHRIREANRQGVPITNYGVLLAHLAGVLERAIEPFRKIYGFGDR